MIIIENHPENLCVFVKCSECEASCIQGSRGAANVLRHKKWCDSKATPTAAQLSGEVAAVAPVAAPTQSGTTRDEYLGNANTFANTYEEARELRRTGHSWRDINSGNHDC